MVHTGSIARKEETPSINSSYKNLRSQLKEKDILVDMNDKSYTFSQGCEFNSITAAAQVVSGMSVNGRAVWRTADQQRTFADWQDEQLNAQVNV